MPHKAIIEIIGELISNIKIYKVVNEPYGIINVQVNKSVNSNKDPRKDGSNDIYTVCIRNSQLLEEYSYLLSNGRQVCINGNLTILQSKNKSHSTIYKPVITIYDKKQLKLSASIKERREINERRINFSTISKNTYKKSILYSNEYQFYSSFKECC